MSPWPPAPPPLARWRAHRGGCERTRGPRLRARSIPELLPTCSCPCKRASPGCACGLARAQPRTPRPPERRGATALRLAARARGRRLTLGGKDRQDGDHGALSTPRWRCLEPARRHSARRRYARGRDRALRAGPATHAEQRAQRGSNGGEGRECAHGALPRYSLARSRGGPSAAPGRRRLASVAAGPPARPLLHRPRPLTFHLNITTEDGPLDCSLAAAAMGARAGAGWLPLHATPRRLCKH